MNNTLLNLLLASLTGLPETRIQIQYVISDPNLGPIALNPEEEGRMKKLNRMMRQLQDAVASQAFYRVLYYCPHCGQLLIPLNWDENRRVNQINDLMDQLLEEVVNRAYRAEIFRRFSNSTDVADLTKAREYLNTVKNRMVSALDQVFVPEYLIQTARAVLSEIEHYLSLMPPMKK
jgi:hypothetical protein